MTTSARSPETAHAAILRFLASSKQPALMEPGEPHIALTPGNHIVELSNGRLTIEAWDGVRNLHRRVTAVEGERPGELKLAIERFGKRPGTLELVDLAAPKAQSRSTREHRHTYREQFRRSLARQFPGWTVASLSTEPDLEHSLSPAFPRALLTRGSEGVAALGTPADGSAAWALTFALIWLEYLRNREKKRQVSTLVLFVPEPEAKATALRLSYLSRSRAEIRLFAYGEGFEAPVDLADRGNIDTVVEARPAAACGEEGESGRILRELSQLPGLEIFEDGSGARSVRVRGLEIARDRDGKLEYGIDARHRARASGAGQIAALAKEVAVRRSPAARDRRDPLFAANPEAWLESRVRAELPAIDATLSPAPVYGQVPALAAADRGVIDLLASDCWGRLAVIELKASEDIHLPVQALDYWIRVEWHSRKGDFGNKGYFPGVSLSAEAPRLLLVAPALEFHPANATVLSYFEPSIEVERIGLGMNWRDHLEVAFRLRGAETR